MKDAFPKIVILVLLAAVLAVPFLLRTPMERRGTADDVVIIITPHNEAIRFEFGRAFREWYQRTTGRTVFVDWRVIGGTSEIARFLSSQYTTTFQALWTRDLNQSWSREVQTAFDNARIALPEDPSEDTPAQAARRAFLSSQVTSGIDLFFGGGSFDFIRQAEAGRLVPTRILQTRPEWFRDEIIPLSNGGEPYYDPDGLWIGAVLSSFGILYNLISLERLGISEPPTTWEDLTAPLYFGELALADPTKSGSMNKAFEMVVQQQMQEQFRRLLAEGQTEEEAEKRAVKEGWDAGMRILLLMAGNARYFTDSSQKPPIDVSQGDSAAGIAIDFYGRFQVESVSRREGPSRLAFVTPPGGSVFSVDPIGLLRGAPNLEVAEAFIEFVLSPEGQKLWNFRAGEPGGPTRFSLRRLPVRRDLYDPKWEPFLSDPTVKPYDDARDFDYRSEWTGWLFRELAFVLRVMTLDPHPELQRAWRAVIDAGLPEDALRVLTDTSVVSYEETSGPIRTILRSGNRLDEIREARRLSNHFRNQYRLAREMAEGSAQ